MAVALCYGSRGGGAAVTFHHQHGADDKDFSLLQEVLEAWTATVHLQRQPGYEAMIERMQRRERGVPAELDELRRLRG